LLRVHGNHRAEQQTYADGASHTGESHIRFLYFSSIRLLSKQLEIQTEN
jgi:hypothetical protein